MQNDFPRNYANLLTLCRIAEAKQAYISECFSEYISFFFPLCFPNMGWTGLHMGPRAKRLNHFVENEMHHLPLPKTFNIF